MTKRSRVKTAVQNVTDKIDETQPATKFAADDLEDSDGSANDQSRKHEHEVDAGMVEISLALSGLVFTAATFAPSLENFPSDLIIFLLTLGLLTDLTSMWFLASFCFQKGIISPQSKTTWRDPRAILHLWKLIPTVYGLLALCLILLLVGYCWVIYATLKAGAVPSMAISLVKVLA